MATIFKRGTKWYCQYRVNGRQVARSLGTGSKRLALLKLGEIRLELERGALGLQRRPASQEAVFEDFHQEVIAKKSAPWAKRMEQLMRNFKQWTLEESQISVTKMTAADIEEFLNKRSQQICNKTLNEELSLIKRFFRWLYRRDYIYKNPSENIERFKYEPKEIRIFTKDELRMIFEHATPTQKPFYELLLYTGLRDGELRNLEWKDVDLSRRMIYVRIKDEWRPKTRRGRVVPLAGEAFELLSGMPKTGKYVFTTRTGKQWVPPRQPWVSLLDRIAQKEGVTLKGQVSLHTFRHTFATTCLMMKVDLKTVSEFLGHSTVRMTEKYLHLLPEHKMQAMKQVSFR